MRTPVGEDDEGKLSGCPPQCSPAGPGIAVHRSMNDTLPENIFRSILKWGSVTGYC